MITDERLDKLISYVAHLASANAEAVAISPPFQAIPLVVDPTAALEIMSELRERRNHSKES